MQLYLWMSVHSTFPYSKDLRKPLASALLHQGSRIKIGPVCLSVCRSVPPKRHLCTSDKKIRAFVHITAWRHDIFRLLCLFLVRILPRRARCRRAVKAQSFLLVIIFFYDDVLIRGCSFTSWRHSPLFLKTASVLLMWKLPKESVCLKDLGKYEENVALGGYVWIWATSHKNRP